MKTQYPMIPFPLIVKATDGDTEAINQILHHYRGYITKRSLRPVSYTHLDVYKRQQYSL